MGDTTLGMLVANPGYGKLAHPRQVFLSDTMRAESEVAELKQSPSRTDAGIVTFAHRLVNQRDEIVCRCLRMALFK